MNRLQTYLNVWLILAGNAVQTTFINRWSNVLFFIGKLLRFGMSLLVLWLIRDHIRLLGEYTTDQLIIFFLVYHWIDLLSQTIYRGVYEFGQYVRSGDFDLVLTRPINPLFTTLAGKPDINDTLFLIPSLIVTIWIFFQLEIATVLPNLFLFMLLFFNGFLIATGLYILVLASTILLTEVDGILWLYRDLLQLGQLPVSLYREPLRFLLFFIIPIGIITTIPAQVFLGEKTTVPLYAVFIIGITFFVFSLKMWNLALKKYSSASS